MEFHQKLLVFNIVVLSLMLILPQSPAICLAASQNLDGIAVIKALAKRSTLSSTRATLIGDCSSARVDSPDITALEQRLMHSLNPAGGDLPNYAYQYLALVYYASE